VTSSRPTRLLATTAVTGLLGLAVTTAAAAPASAKPGSFQRACAPAHGRVATCFASYRTLSGRQRANAATTTQPSLTPADIVSAYKLPASSNHPTVAIVDAFDNPKAESNLKTYRAKYHLPACTTANGCFRKVNQRGQASPLPEGDPGWGVEISLDLDAVSSACPDCHVLLVEGDEPDIDSLGIAENTAVRLGAAVVSNSYGMTEFNGMSAYGNRYYKHPGTAIVVSTGDFGFEIPNFPAVLSTSIAVGGTSLTKAPGTTRGWTEQAWEFADSGCSGYVAKPAWQHDAHCLTRTVADVSAVADPDSGFIVYDTYGLGSDGGYIQVGGTSLSAPLIAGMIGRAGNASTLSNASYIYAHTASIFDVKGGSNGFCGHDYLCTGVKGYDGPTGVGTPNGLGAL
jgi:subtilase family serine protease